MITKRLVLATSVMVFVAMAGQAYAGTTISDTRYWPSEVRSTNQPAVQRAANAFDAVQAPRGIEATRQAYEGGPKGNS